MNEIVFISYSGFEPGLDCEKKMFYFLLNRQQVIFMILGSTILTFFSMVIMVAVNIICQEYTSVKNMPPENFKVILVDKDLSGPVQSLADPPKELLSEDFKYQLPQNAYNFSLEDLKITSILFESSSSKLFKATDIRTNRPVAIKAVAFYPKLEHKRLGRCRDNFLIERTSMMLLKDAPFISKIIYQKELTRLEALKMFQNEMFRGIIVMEYFKKGDLGSFLENESERAVPLNLVKKLMSQLIVALQHVHSHGLVHRDVKTKNLLISDSEDIFLCDFGIAKRFKTKTSRNSAFGTLIYLAPETLQNQQTSWASDIFAAGVVLYCLIGPANAETIVENSYISSMRTGGLNACVKLASSYAERPFPSYVPPLLLNLFKRMVDPDPKQRISLLEIMRHSFFSDVDWFALGALEI